MGIVIAKSRGRCSPSWTSFPRWSNRLSIDEAFLDLTGTQRSPGEPADVAQRLKDRIRSDLQLTASIGLPPNKFLAKLASDINKPDGLTIIAQDDIDRVLLPLPVDRLWGEDKATAAKLNEMGIQTIGDLRQLSMERMRHYFGSDAERYHNLIRGIDDRPVVTDREAKSIGHEQTFAVDLADQDEVRRVLHDQVQRVARCLRKHGLAARGFLSSCDMGPSRPSLAQPRCPRRPR